jgi:prepilin-type N-terminal cleavage/methylation domain-containing protein
MTINNKQGFTLIELIVIIGIISILATISIISFKTSQSKARDAIRLSDVQQLAVALDYYYDDNKRTYPECGYVCDFDANWQNGCLGEALKPYIKELPRDPSKRINNGYCYYTHYNYNVDNKQDVVLTFSMEDINPSTGNATFRFWQNSAYYYSLSVKTYLE